MRYLMTATLLLAGIGPARANIVEFSFSGTFASTFGVIQAGDSFSGDATWDTASVGVDPSFPTFAPLLSYTFNLPAADGLSVTALPDPAVLFAGANYPAGAFTFLQIDEKSTVDQATYVFFIGPVGASVTDVAFSKAELASQYGSSGPNPAPEPGSRAFAATVLGLLIAFVSRRRIARTAV